MAFLYTYELQMSQDGDMLGICIFSFEWKFFISPKVDFFSILHTNIAISGEQIVHLPESVGASILN